MMRISRLELLICLTLLLLSCNGINKEGSLRTKWNINTEDRITIIIQPFDLFPNTSTNLVAKELKKIFKGSVLINDPIQFPKNTLNKTKKRHRADSLIKYLSNKTKKGSVTIGLAIKDISYTRKNKDGVILDDDYGIMGLGYRPGKSCIVSTSRIKGHNKKEKLFKVAIHELGHTQGLEHCSVRSCLMRDAEGKDHLNELKEFCPKCKSVLIKAGWELK